MQKSDRIAAATGVLIAFTGLVVSISFPVIGAIAGAAYAASAFGTGVLAKIGFGVLGLGGGFIAGKTLSDPVLFMATMAGAAAAKTVKVGAAVIRKTKAVLKFGFSPVAKNGRPKRGGAPEERRTVFQKISSAFKKSAARKTAPQSAPAQRPQPGLA